MNCIQGEIFEFHDANEFEGLCQDLTNQPATFRAVDAFALPLPNYATLGDLNDNPNMEAELAVIPNTNMGGLFDFLKSKPKKPKPAKQQTKLAPPAPMPVPQSKMTSFVDQYGKYVVVGVGTVALIAVIALLMTSKKETP